VLLIVAAPTPAARTDDCRNRGRDGR